MILRAKTKDLFGWELTKQQRENSRLNLQELEEGAVVLRSLPRRLVFELTNMCNLNCIMCGRNAATFRPTRFSFEWFSYFEPLLDTVEEVTLMGWGEPTLHPQFAQMLAVLGRHAARTYFCTNGMLLDELTPAIFESHTDLIGVSVDGATQETNGRIRRGSDLGKIVASLTKLEEEKRTRGLSAPYINFVFCAMDSNLGELPDLVRLAASIGLQEVKVVYLTVFSPQLRSESLWGQTERVRDTFARAAELAQEHGVAIKLPYLPGEDPAGERLHRDCYVGWRDFFLGSDGFVRPCMSTSQKLFALDVSQPFLAHWNHPALQWHRACVNDAKNMAQQCRSCYQSSHCNWNRQEAFLQIGNHFSPEW